MSLRQAREINELREQLAAANARIDELMNRLEALEKRRPGRPRKEDNGTE